MGHCGWFEWGERNPSTPRNWSLREAGYVMYVCMYVCMYVHMYVFTHKHQFSHRKKTWCKWTNLIKRNYCRLARNVFLCSSYDYNSLFHKVYFFLYHNSQSKLTSQHEMNTQQGSNALTVGILISRSCTHIFYLNFILTIRQSFTINNNLSNKCSSSLNPRVSFKLLVFRPHLRLSNVSEKKDSNNEKER